ncbi:50S ribosomal protein L24 [Neomicrococcus aestuarii]|jgi:large subunit ribosomal protein L24|uniref:Large ribosomal subunit protein uL24 n=1 Tax=Neomicrococcus aestuarii TaxID=556325 RepID=A0A1L2ZQ45_9MICC|nr:50S ribosomal protein L24 [Neomicrococcus aestuarii]APF41504.1 50S ribosomal protein L24 [Neomicrococcus aestuarii]MBB5513560.1 large subunit ribosomal protein L24 [Neomicrococcus aestuarii]
MGAKIKKDDLVQVISGKDKGKTGKVLRVLPEGQRVLVEGVNRVTKHVRAGQNESGAVTGGITVVEAPVHVSNVMVVDPETKKPTRVGFREEEVEKNGVKKTVRVRFAKASGKAL